MPSNRKTKPRFTVYLVVSKVCGYEAYLLGFSPQQNGLPGILKSKRADAGCKHELGTTLLPPGEAETASPHIMGQQSPHPRAPRAGEADQRSSKDV